MAEAVRWIVSLFRRREIERDLDEEMRFHLECRAEENRAGGMSDADARRVAERQFGDRLRTREDASRARGWDLFDRTGQDLRWAFRTLRRSPAFTVASVLTLALGIGANAAIFTVVNAVLVQPLPFPQAGRLAEVFEVSRVFGRSEATEAVYGAWQAQATSLDRIAAFTASSRVLVGSEGADELAGGSVTASFFAMLGAKPWRGRLLGASDMQAGSDSVVVLAYDTWQRRLGGREDVVGRPIVLGGEARVVVGVLPPSFRFEPLERRRFAEPAAVEFWTPLRLVAVGNAATDTYYLRTLARLRPGASVAAARTELAAIAARTTGRESSADVGLLRDELVRGSRRTLLFLFAAVGLVLLIACANVAHLQLARGMSRGREMAIRVAVGAGRGRLVAQMLVESVVVSGLGALAGVAGAEALLGPLVRMAGSDLPRSSQVHIDPLVLVFVVGLAALSAVSFGLLPAMRTSNAAPVVQLRGGPSPGSGRVNRRLTRGLVLAEISLALVLIVCAGSMLASLWHARNVDIGFSTDRLLTLRTVLPRERYKDGRSVGFYDRALEAIRQVPGVESAAAANTLPMGGAPVFQGFAVEGSARTAGSEASIRGQYRTITPGYFRTLGIPLLHGRAFDAGDRDGTRLVAIVNETAERRHFGGHAVGRRLISGNGSEPYEVVGVVGDIRHESARSEPLPEVYYALAQDPSRRMWLAVRTTGNPSDVAGRVRQVLTTLDPEVPVDHVRTMAERREAALGVSTFLAALLTGFALLALGLACVGHYGVVSYGVARRTHEIGMRLVLGASPGGVLRMVVRETLSVAVGGVLLAVPLAALASRVLSSFLYGVAPGDPLIFATAAGLMLATAAAAAFLPAWRASRVEAVSALRHE